MNQGKLPDKSTDGFDNAGTIVPPLLTAFGGDRVSKRAPPCVWILRLRSCSQVRSGQACC